MGVGGRGQRIKAQEDKGKRRRIEKEEMEIENEKDLWGRFILKPRYMNEYEHVQ